MGEKHRNKTVIRKDLVNNIVLRLHGKYSYKEIDEIVKGFLEEIKEILYRGQRIELRRFGVFKVTKRRRRKFKMVNSNNIGVAPMKYVPFFKPSKNFKDFVNLNNKHIKY